VFKPGHGKGVLPTMWKKGLTKYVSKIKCHIFRIQATKFIFPNAELLVLNLYFMVDSQNNNMNDLELLSLLGGIDRILFITECKNVLLVGDINYDFSRPTHFVHIRTFAEEKGLNIFWNLPDNDRIKEID